MKFLFITGTPNAGKSTLARKIAKLTHGIHIDLDELRKEMWQNEKLRKWVDFFQNKDEKEYWENTSPEEDFKNIIHQSEAFWPTILKKIEQFARVEKPVIFEAVNILPHLAKKDLDFEGIILINSSFEETFKRLQSRPRWSKELELQKIEAERFVQQAEYYKQEAEKYKYRYFEDVNEAEKYLQELLKI